MSGETTRRGLIARAIAAGAGAGLLGPSDAGAAQVPAGDSALLHTVLASELLAVYCYQRVLASGLLDGRTMRLATQVLVQERAHVRAVRGALAASGGVPPQAPASPAAADRELSILLVPNRLAELHNREDARKLLIALEGVLEGAYFVAIGRLSDPGTLRLAAEIMANEAQHDVLLRLLAHEREPEEALPSALVQGTFPKKLTGSLG
ncbi:MAG TPA: ferritin-like domain-containing protein [Solirubrobacteraceae bacterium]|jgi:ferritin-like protein